MHSAAQLQLTPSRPTHPACSGLTMGAVLNLRPDLFKGGPGHSHPASPGLLEAGLGGAQ